MTAFSHIGAPEHELTRSSAARVIGDLAKASGLFLSHFEYRYHMPLPEVWCPPNQPDVSAQPYWKSGHLVEHKYRHFRYDNPIGSFHPSHDPKWAAHELCHALIGFAWTPGAPPLFHSLSARLSELLPVALWYFFDEIDLRRCEQHAGLGDLFGQRCDACDASAMAGPTSDKDTQFLKEGLAFVDRELAAIARTRRTGIPTGHRYATIDLSNDALTWTAANRLRLESDEFRWFRHLFLGPEQGAFTDLDAQEARVVELMNAITERGVARPLVGDRSTWICQDLAWRILMVAMDCDGECRTELEKIIVTLADTTKTSVKSSLVSYQALCEDWYLPPFSDVFAVGYPLCEGVGWSIDQITNGLEETLPNTTALLGDALPPVLLAFAEQETPRRTPLARRFTQFLSDEAPGPTAEVARYETAFIHPSSASIMHDALYSEKQCDETQWTIAPGVERLHFQFDVPNIIASVDRLPETLPQKKHHLLVKRASDGELDILELTETAFNGFAQLETMPSRLDQIKIDAKELDSLVRLGFIVPVRYPLLVSSRGNGDPRHVQDPV